jgi:alpha-ribazole phosphatase
MKLFLIRHPKPQIAQGICYGQLDMPADPQDLERVAQDLLKLPVPALCATSPLIRASALAQRMAQLGWPNASTHDDLREMLFGRWEGQAWDQIAREQIDAWAQDSLHYQPPEGESVMMLANRAHRAVSNIIDTARKSLYQTNPHIAVFAHAGVLHTVSALLQNQPVVVKGLSKLDYGAVITLDL